MTTDEQMFLAAIAAAPDDQAVHGAYADWLDEHDRPEEADWHRAWTPARRAEGYAWLARFAEGHTDPYSGDRPYTADDMAHAGRRWLGSDSWNYTTQDGGTTLQDEMYSEATRWEWWTNWALATGTYVPAAVAADGYVFSCSC